ncbi:cell envelope integrity protein TolA [Bartonella sp. HY406]|uniref:cell envelope integrity protein TolA n=1 Tax=Bartonella sp. HY406 TaxID=2979331 RepID=UPI0021C8A6D2|nr:energy transducer TonB [Bartonella sp. HY406]UXN02891.1 TonB family protein [Bartonella sp. HY406]
MQGNIGQDSSGQKQSPFILPAAPWWHKCLLWGGAAIFVTFFYVAAAVALYRFGNEPDRLAGSPPALMLVFAEEVTAPDSPNLSEEVQAETQVNEPEVEEKPEEEPEPEPEPLPEPEPVVEDVKPDPVVTPPSDMVEEIKKEEPKEEPKEEKVKPTPKPEKPEPKKVERPERKKTPPPKRQAQRADRNQKAAAPIVDAKQGSTFAAPRTSTTDGLGGKLFDDWKGKVQVKLRSMANRVRRQAGGLTGTAMVQFSYDASGRVTSTRISRSSGNDRVNEIALKVVQMASPIPTPPKGGGSLTVPIQIR